MNRMTMAAQRRLFGWCMTIAACAAVYWTFFSEGMPILWGPSASAAEISEGRDLFEHEWTPNDPLAHGDGLGPVFNAKSCAACHFQGGLGGGGEVMHNALGYEVLPRPGDPTFKTGGIHKFSVDPSQKETFAALKKLYPTIKGSTTTERRGDPHCSYTATITIPDFDPVSTQSVQTTALYGAGWIDLMSDKAIRKNYRERSVNGFTREMKLQFDGVPVGRLLEVKGGVGKFGWKGQFARLQDFVAAACANELGLGTSHCEQAKPITGPSSNVEPDLDRSQFRALVSFVKTLPRPIEAEASSLSEQSAVERGKAVFTSVGCAICHVPDMGGVKGVYSDFLLYTLEDPQSKGGSGYDNEAPRNLNLPGRSEDLPKPSEWKTPALWGVADSAPYMHDGSAPTLADAIRAHNGDAKTVLTAYTKLPQQDQAALMSFLKTLKAPPTATPLRNQAITRLAKR